MCLMYWIIIIISGVHLISQSDENEKPTVCEDWILGEQKYWDSIGLKMKRRYDTE